MLTPSVKNRTAPSWPPRPPQRPWPLLALALGLLLASGGCSSFGKGLGSTPANLGPAPVMDASGAMEAGGSGVVRGGAQDAAYFRHSVAQGQIPHPDEITVEGLFAEHDTPLPTPRRDRAITLHPMLGVSVDPIEDTPVAVIQLGMNSHLDFSGLPRLPVNLAVVIDKSGSMNDQGKMDYVKEGLKLMLESLGPQDTLSLVTYDTAARVVIPPTRLDRPRTVATIIDNLYPGGATNLHDGLALGLEQLMAAYDPQAVNRLMILSDGRPTVGHIDPEAILSVAHGAFADANVTLSAIGVGDDLDHALMVQLARDGGGNFHFLRDPQRIRTVFRDELETTLTPLAQDVLLRVELDREVELLASHGIPLAIGPTGDPELFLPTLYLSRRNGVMLLELALGDLLDYDGPVELGRITLEYTLLGSQRRERATYPLVVPQQARTPHGEVVFFESDAIRRNFDLLMSVYALQDACEAWHHGDHHVAAAIMAHLEAWLGAEAADLRDDGLHRELANVRRLRASISPRWR